MKQGLTKQKHQGQGIISETIPLRIDCRHYLFSYSYISQSRAWSELYQCVMRQVLRQMLRCMGGES